MSNWGEDYDNDTQSNGNNDGAGDGLRSYIKNLEAQNKELNTKLTSFLEDQQKQKMNVVFESLGVPGAATVYQGEADPEAAKAWVQSMQSVFGTAQVAHATGSNEPVQPVMDATQQQTFQNFSQAGGDGAVVGKYELAAGELRSGKSPDEILAIMNGFGGGQ